MATIDTQGVIFLDPNGTDEIKHYPAWQRNNATRLSGLWFAASSGFSVNNSLPETHATFYRIGRVGMLTLLIKTGTFTQAPELFPGKINNSTDRPKDTWYSTLNGSTTDGTPVAIILKLTPDGKLTRLEETPLAQNATYAGTLTWVTVPRN